MSKSTQAPLSVTVGGEEYRLEPTLSAVRSINGVLGGLRPAFQRVSDINFDAMAAVVAAGAGLALKPKEFDALAEAIWKSPDKAAIGGTLSDFLALLLAGGQAAGDGEAEDAGGN